MKKVFSRVFDVVLVVVLVYAIWNYFQNQSNVNSGEAPDFEFVTLKGDKVKLSDFRGEFVLLDFWASWCGPCRMSNPKLVKFEKKYRKNGLKVISISVDSDGSAWKKAIEKDNLTWDLQCLDSQTNPGGISNKYDVKKIPSKFLIDPEGNIIGVDMMFYTMSKRLDKSLKN